MNINGASL
jgi:hypothetical protein